MQHVYSTANHVSRQELRAVEKERDLLELRLQEALEQAQELQAVRQAMALAKAIVVLLC